MPPLHIREPQRCRLAGMGTAFPDRLPDGSGAEFDNDAVIRLLAPSGPRGPRDAEEIREVAASLSEALGVKRRCWCHRPGDPVCHDEETSLDLQTLALGRALVASGIAAAELGAVIATTSTPPRVTAGSAPAIAERVSARCASFDVRAGCAGGVHALVLGSLMVSTSGQPVAVAAGDTFSKILPPGEPLAGLALADGAAALILVPERSGRCGLLAASLCADGGLGHLGTSPSPFPPSREAIDEGLYVLTGSPDELARRTPSLYASAIAETLQLAGMSADAVDLFIPHQAGLALARAVGGLTGFAPDRVYCPIDRHANIGAASVLAALHEALEDRSVASGQTVLLAALGGGLCWGAALLRL